MIVLKISTILNYIIIYILYDYSFMKFTCKMKMFFYMISRSIFALIF
jgi:hypothetical protein